MFEIMTCDDLPCIHLLDILSLLSVEPQEIGEIGELDRRTIERLTLLVLLCAKVHLSNGTQPLLGFLICLQLWQVFIYSSRVISAWNYGFSFLENSQFSIRLLEAAVFQGHYVLEISSPISRAEFFHRNVKWNILFNIVNCWLTQCYITLYLLHSRSHEIRTFPL